MQVVKILSDQVQVMNINNTFCFLRAWEIEMYITVVYQQATSGREAAGFFSSFLMSFASFPLKKYQILKEIARQIYHSCEISIYQYLYHTVSFRFQFTTVAQISIYHGSSEMVISIYPISNFNLPQ